MQRQEPIYDEYGLTQWHWLVRYKENFKLGKNTEIGAFTVIDAENGVIVEDNVKVGFGCIILSESSIDNKSNLVILKNNCNLGSKSVVMPGVIIGNNSIVGANSFVNKSIPDNEIWFGSPAVFYKNVNS